MPDSSLSQRKTENLSQEVSVCMTHIVSRICMVLPIENFVILVVIIFSNTRFLVEQEIDELALVICLEELQLDFLSIP